MPDKVWDARTQEYVSHNRNVRAQAARTDPMPEVSDRFIEWLDRQPLPEIGAFETLDPNTALKQVSWQAGIRFLKQKIAAEQRLNKNRDVRLGETPT